MNRKHQISPVFVHETFSHLIIFRIVVAVLDINHMHVGVPLVFRVAQSFTLVVLVKMRLNSFFGDWRKNRFCDKNIFLPKKHCLPKNQTFQLKQNHHSSKKYFF